MYTSRTNVPRLTVESASSSSPKTHGSWIHIAIFEVASGMEYQQPRETQLFCHCTMRLWRRNTYSVGRFNLTLRLILYQQPVKRRKEESTSSKCIDCSFIIGSVVEVERLWNVAKLILSESRQSTTPEIFESLVFLKLNDRFCDVELDIDSHKACIDEYQ